MADLPLDGTAITADGDYDVVVDAIENDVVITGTFGGGTIEVQHVSPFNSANDAPISGATGITADWTNVIQCRKGSTLRFNLSGSTTPSIQISITSIRNG